VKKVGTALGLVLVLVALLKVGSKYVDKYIGPADTHRMSDMLITRADQFLGLLLEVGKAAIHLVS
jgi:hypothetical protein